MIQQWLVNRSPLQTDNERTVIIDPVVAPDTLYLLEDGAISSAGNSFFCILANSFRRTWLYFLDIHRSACITCVSRLCLCHDMERISTLARKPNFARYLRDARIKRGLSVAEVAEEVGVSTASIYFWETDHVRPRDANLSALCKVLRLPIRATREMAAA